MTAICKQGGCDKPPRRIGYCATHYKRHRLGGDMSAPIRTMGGGMLNFWPKVQKGEGCWEWTAARDAKGYGQFKHRGGMRLAHRVAYENERGPIPAGLQIDHTCWNRACVNPAHLRLADNALNAQNRAGARSDSMSGVRGVYWDKREKRWRADGMVNGRRTFLGHFRRIEDATTAATAWRRENMPYSLMDQRLES